jgi:AcrR family transcriptional regulator
VTSNAGRAGTERGRPLIAPPNGPSRTRRDEILDTAAAVFASSGYAGASLKDIAGACAILPGSLYHHFESKEAIVIELIQRYQGELDRIGAIALDSVEASDAPSVRQQILTLSTSIAQAAIHHRAALQLTAYEPPAGASEQLVELVKRPAGPIYTAMLAIMRRGQVDGAIKPDIDVVLLADELCETMRHVGIDSLHRNANARRVAAILCHLLLDGGATRPPRDPELDESAARVAADTAIQGWSDVRWVSADGKTALLLAAARTEFARRGYEATTVRDIAAAAGMGTGSVYRFIESKDAMLESIMRSFHAKLTDGYQGVMNSPATEIEKLDALTWLNINILESSREEFAIQRAWRRSIPPEAGDLNVPQRERARQIRSLVATGMSRGELRAAPGAGAAASIDVVAMCYRDLMWPSTNVVLVGRQRTLAHRRATLWRGAATDGEPTGATLGETVVAGNPRC